MTSVVDTSVKHYHSGMAGAPVLSGQVGKLIDVLDACLVNGFDVRSATGLSVSAGVATLAFVGTHSATVDSVIEVSGSSVAELNGEQKVTFADAGIVKFATAAANGTASGSISFKMAGAGWQKAFSGTNLAAYKSNNVQAHGMYFRVNDANATEARLIGYETMTAISTGTGLFPTTAQLNGGAYWNKANSAGSAAVPWELFSDGRFMLWKAATYFVDGGPDYTGGWLCGFGDLIPLRLAGDPYATAMVGADAAGGGYSANGFAGGGYNVGATCARPVSGQGSAQQCLVAPWTGSRGIVSGDDSFFGDFPSYVTGNLLMSRSFVCENTGTPPRANVPGVLYLPQQYVARRFANRQIVECSGDLAGRRAMLVYTGYPVYLPSGNLGAVLIDITGPWR